MNTDSSRDLKKPIDIDEVTVATKVDRSAYLTEAEHSKLDNSRERERSGVAIICCNIV